MKAKPHRRSAVHPSMPLDDAAQNGCPPRLTFDQLPEPGPGAPSAMATCIVPMMRSSSASVISDSFRTPRSTSWLCAVSRQPPRVLSQKMAAVTDWLPSTDLQGPGQVRLTNTISPVAGTQRTRRACTTRPSRRRGSREELLRRISSPPPEDIKERIALCLAPCRHESVVPPTLAGQFAAVAAPSVFRVTINLIRAIHRTFR